MDSLASANASDRLLELAKGEKDPHLRMEAIHRLGSLSRGKTGDALVKLGESQWGIGKGQDAVKLVQAGIQKGVADKDNAQIRLGMGYLAAGQKESAARAFAAVKTDPKQAVIAHTWALYARR